MEKYTDKIKKKVILEVSFDESFKGVHSNWFGYLSTRKETVNAMDLIIAEVEKHGVQFLINENTNLKGTWPCTQEDIDEWMSSLKKLNLKKLAHVVSPSTLGQQSSEMLVNEEWGMMVMYFDNFDNAQQWMNE